MRAEGIHVRKERIEQGDGRAFRGVLDGLREKEREGGRDAERGLCTGVAYVLTLSRSTELSSMQNQNQNPIGQLKRL